MDIIENNKIINKYLENILQTNNYSHAYLFVGQNDQDIETYIKLFVKSIFCLNNDENKLSYCNECKICKQIDNNNYLDFYIVNNEDGKIKKEDIVKLKDELSLRASYNKKIYWIKNIDKFTRQAANSILKVLEEPEENIIAILSTSNENQVLETILSRCQIVKINSVEKNIEKDDNYLLIQKNFLNFVGSFSKNKNLAILNLLESLTEKESVLLFFEVFKNEILEKQNCSNQYLAEKAYLLENILNSIKKINYNVSSNLVIENFLFNLAIDNIDISFLIK